MRKYLAAVALALLCAQASSQTNSGPTYEETVAWLQGAARVPFMELSRCRFSHKKFSDGPQEAHFGSLLTTSQVEERTMFAITVRVNCAVNACVTQASYDGKDRSNESSFLFYANHELAGERVMNALRRLAILCGAKEVRTNTF